MVELDQKQLLIVNQDIKNILINAGAGTGKTRVLTERIINNIKLGKYNIENILVVTFTKAAAKEMKDRILLALKESINTDENNLHILQAISNIDNANISTIDSLCNKLVKENYIQLNIDSKFRILDENESKILQYDTIDDIFENEYSKLYNDENTAFSEFISIYAKNGNDNDVKKFIIDIVQQAMSHTNPKKWIKDISNLERLKNFYVDIFKKMIDDVKTLKTVLDDNNINVTSNEYNELLKVNFDRIFSFHDVLSLSTIYSTGKVLKRPSKKVDIITFLYNEINYYINILYYSQFLNFEIEKMQPLYDEVVRLSFIYMDNLATIKKIKNAYEFNDIAHFTLSLLTCNGKNTNLAKQLSENIAEIYVDEYQDVNNVQEEIITSLSGNTRGANNMFMVGDIKQSIYRFRAANPDIFNKKLNTYSNDINDSNILMTMNKNYRSSKNVIDAINDIFSKLMVEDFGNIDFTGKHELEYNLENLHHLKNKLVNIEKTKTDKDFESDEYIARYIANEIINIKNNITYNKFIDGKLIEVNYKYSDFVVLVHKKNTFSNVIKTFEEFNIPYFAKSKTGFLSSKEIKLLISFLRIIDNPYIDIDLASVLFSDFVGLDAQHLLDVTNLKGQNLYDKLLNYIEDTNSDTFSVNRIKIFLEKFIKIFNSKNYIQIDELIQKIFDEFKILEYFLALSNSKIRISNLQLLLTLAKNFTRTQDYSITGFLKYINDIKERKFDIGEAISEAEEDCVTIRTIHDSKGTENKVVFLISKAKDYSKSIGNNFKVDSKHGYLLKPINFDYKYFLENSAIKKYYQDNISKDELGEWIRVSYVALTRAEHAFYIISTDYKILDKCDKMLDVYYSNSDRLNLSTLANTFNEKLNNKIFVESIPASSIYVEGYETINNESYYNASEILTNAKEFIRQYRKKDIKEFVNRKYTVSGIKKVETDDKVEREEILAGIDNNKQKGLGSNFGLAVHSILKFLDFNNPDENIDFLIDYYSKLYKTSVSKSIFYNFLNTDLGIRCKKASIDGRLFREDSFVLRDSINKIFATINSNKFNNIEHDVILQGMFDGYIIEDDKIILFDYKTDNNLNIDYFKDKYKTQMKLYKYALENIFEDMKVSEIYIYSSRLNKVIEVNEIED